MRAPRPRNDAIVFLLRAGRAGGARRVVGSVSCARPVARTAHRLTEGAQMTTRIDMPQLGLTMETGTILQWLKVEGDRTEKGQPVVLIQTDKVEYEVEAPASGTLLKIAAKEGAELPVGSLMGVIGQPGEDLAGLTGAAPVAAAEPAQAAPRAAAPAPPAASRSAAVAPPAPAPPRAPGERVKISPVAKKLAQDHGIDVATLTGTGPEGRIVREDVEKAIAAKAAAPTP
ncbi:MAG: hypothetical protein EHM71_03745, partial [Zetaproteobacteria bacterium]